MFLYWDGYEIDGSDTDFNIVLPESVQISELADCFLGLPVFDKEQKPEFVFNKGNKQKKISYHEWKKVLLNGDFTSIYITINCLHPEELPEELRQKIYSISERREPREEAWGKVEHPCTPPVKQHYYTRGDMTVMFFVGRETVSADEELDGYITNVELIQNSKEMLPCVRLNMGPGFYYEYAMYIVDSLRDSFPSVATYGGLDCEGGWTFGCTYADSLYLYEKLEIPVRYSIKNTLKHYCDCDVLMPCIWYYQGRGGWKAECTDGFVLAENSPSYLDSKDIKKLDRLSFGEYADLAQEVLSAEESAFEIAVRTAVRFILPKPENFSPYCEEAVSRLKQAELSCETGGDWYDLGYFCFSKMGEQETIQFRVPYQRKAYLCALLELLEAGKLDKIKPETYRRRHESENKG